MFSRTSKKPDVKKAEPPVSKKPAPPSIISTDVRIVGDLNSTGEIQVDGDVDGDIRTKILLVGETATIKGEIIADTIRVFGTVKGQIRARAVTLAKTAHVVGDVLHEDLSIEKGAFLEGHCRRISDEPGVAEKINVLGGSDAGTKAGAKNTGSPVPRVLANTA